MASKKVAVVGCGVAGLAAAPELSREGHKVVVFERGSQLGGIWAYTSDTESDLLGVDPNRTIVHHSLYKSLRTNSPRELTGFREFPFVATGKPNRDSRRYPSHEEVLRYLEDFAGKFRLNELIRYQTEVLFVGKESDGNWKVKSKRKNTDELDETYNAVVVCNGHFTEPKIAHIPGIEVWPGWQCHSHNYRTPEPYQDQVVVLIGASASAVDICKEIAAVAKEVHLACRSEQGRDYIKKLGINNLFLHPMIDKAHYDGRVAFQDSSEVFANVILHCTGYKYQFPFLHTGGAVNVDDNRVGPLYKHVFPPALAPGLSFVGIPYFSLLFILFELQSKWIAGVLSGRLSLPSEENMMQDIEAFYSKLDSAEVEKQYTHRLADFQFELEDWVAKECGCPPIEEWKKGMFFAEFTGVITHPGTYRDELNSSEELYLQAVQEFKQYSVIERGSDDDSSKTPCL